jgi:hypothetical protein
VAEAEEEVVDVEEVAVAEAVEAEVGNKNQKNRRSL